MLTPYWEILEQLLRYGEFRSGLSFFRALLLACIGLMVCIVLLHSLYFLGYKTPMYRKKAPVDGWNCRFGGAVVLVIALLASVIWGVGILLSHVSAE